MAPKLTVLILFQKINGPHPASFCLFSFFSRYNYSTNLMINDKSIDGVLGSQSQGLRMIGSDKSTVLCVLILFLSVSTMPRSSRSNSRKSSVTRSRKDFLPFATPLPDQLHLSSQDSDSDQSSSLARQNSEEEEEQVGLQ